MERTVRFLQVFKVTGILLRPWSIVVFPKDSSDFECNSSSFNFQRLTNSMTHFFSNPPSSKARSAHRPGDKDLFGDQVLRCHRSTPNPEKGAWYKNGGLATLDTL
ncbi:hypothetical protein TNCV_289501 [Trichonephila clavipes]|nr:hypothetical protein TNCV_289501 [Trichonephila clavipes]